MTLVVGLVKNRQVCPAKPGRGVRGRGVGVGVLDRNRIGASIALAPIH